ncbi:MAG TPA: hypothetical protein VK601_21325, partial [Kofleriaceae bacterium]|nr:hypothetical protein [Kofleriaceae bacterium]
MRSITALRSARRRPLREARRRVRELESANRAANDAAPHAGRQCDRDYAARRRPRLFEYVARPWTFDHQLNTEDNPMQLVPYNAV